MACPFRWHVVLGEAEWLARRHAELPLHQVEPGHQLGHRVLHLEAGVHLEEEELTLLVEELDRAGVHVPAGLGDLDRGLAHGPADLVGEVGGRALLHQLLVPSLGRAVPFAQPQRVAVGVGDDLHLHVAGPGQVALDVALVPAEVGERLAHGRLEGLAGVRRDPATTFIPRPPPPKAALMATGQPNSFAEGGDLVRRRQHLGPPRDARHAGPLGGMAGADLVAHDLDGLGRGPDEGDPPLGDGPGEVGVLREEAVAGVDGVGAALSR